MKARTIALLTAFCAGAGGLAACATSEPTSESHDDPSSVSLSPAPDAGDDRDAAGDADAETADACVGECELFPHDCTDDVLCLTGPFASSMNASFDGRTQVNVIRGRSSTDVWVAGALGAIAHFDGTSWTRSNLGSTETMRALWLGSFGEVAMGVFDRMYVRDASEWLVLLLPPPTVSEVARLQSCWSAPNSNTAWCATVAKSYGDTTGLWRLRHSESEGFTLQAGILNDQCRAAGCSQMLAIHGASPDDLWAVGMGGAIVRIAGAEGEQPSADPYNSQTWSALRSVWATSANDAWAVGVGGTVRHYTGSRIWEIVADIPTIKDLNAIWASSANDIWVAGEDGVVLHNDGTGWSRVKIAGLGAKRPALTTIWGASPGHVWIGGEGVVLTLGGKP